jgi:DNA polymerase II small subunit/DNA polymerase delta subunit B
MQSQDIVRELTKKGVLVTPEILKKIKDDPGSIQDLQKKPKTGAKKRLSVKIIALKNNNRMSPQDFTAYYNNRFSKIKNMLLKKMDALSINKVKEEFSQVSVIGMVREKTAQGFILEDMTGEIDVVSNESVKQDDVIGITGAVREGKLFQSEAIWPDVPLTNKPNTITETTLLLTTFLDENLVKTIDGFSLVFFFGKADIDLSDDKKTKLFELQNPCSATINKEGKDYNILVYKPPEPIIPKEAICYLKRRHLSPKKDQIKSTIDQFIIDPVPDLFWVVSNQRHIERYKGVTLIMGKENDAVRFDAESGDVCFAYDKPVAQAKSN